MKGQVLLLLLTLLLPGLSLQAQKRQEDRKASEPVILRNATQLNTFAREFAPVRYQSGIVYVTSREKFGPRDERTGETFFELYFAELDPDGMPMRPQPFSVALNSPMHENAVAFNRMGDRIFLTRNNMENGLTRADSKGRIRMKIYEAERGEYDWENIRPLPFNSDEYSCIHPSLSPDGAKLFFASDMPGGLGGFDLWFVLRQDDGGWTDPINLGPRVNSTRNEVFPFVHESGVLFFSSDGNGSKGGLDVFMIDISQNRWGDVKSLGEPFNTESDDFSFNLDPDGRRGFFASNREGGFGGDDIYVFEAPNGLRGIRSLQIQVNLLNIRDQETGRPLAGVDIRLFEQAADGMLQDRGLYEVQLAPSPANHDSLAIRYVLKNEEELGEPKAVSDRLGEARVDLAAGSTYLMLFSRAGYETQQISFTPRRGVTDPLVVNMPPTACLTLNGSVITETQNRPVTNAAVRIVNECTGEAVLLQSKLNGQFDYCLPTGCDFTVMAEKNGFQSVQSRISTVKIRGSRSLTLELKLNGNAETATDQPLREGTVIILEDLIYDFNQSTIRTKEASALEALAQLMLQNPSMEIELGAHTDSRGSAEYNLKLSFKRAEAAREFLVQRGILANRIKAFGYGESRLRNRCVDGVECSEEEHEFNRRTEVRVTRIDEKAPVEIRKPSQPAPAQGMETKGN